MFRWFITHNFNLKSTCKFSLGIKVSTDKKRKSTRTVVMTLLGFPLYLPLRTVLVCTTTLPKITKSSKMTRKKSINRVLIFSSHFTKGPLFEKTQKLDIVKKH